MGFKLRDLNNVKNKVLCQIEDYIADAIIDNLDDMQGEDVEANKRASTAMAKEVTKAVKENVRALTMICYMNEDGSDIKEEQLDGVPMVIKMISEGLPVIMGLVSEHMNGSSGGESSGKSKRITPQRS